MKINPLIKKENLIQTNPNETISSLFKRYNHFKKYKKINSLPIIPVLNKNTLVGSITNGDIKNYLANKSLKSNSTVKEFMNIKPVKIYESFLKKNFYAKLKKIRSQNKNLIINEIFVVNTKNEFIGILPTKQKEIDYSLVSDCNTNVIGLGFVGITLAIHLANKGVTVDGFDKNIKLIADYKKAKISFYEEGLYSNLKKSISSNNINFNSSFSKLRHNIYIISVGTPVNEKTKQPIYKELINVLSQIGKKITSQTMIFMRSTIPLGSSRKIFVPLLEKISKLKCGEDFFYLMAPERTIEGNALKELYEIPQIIGGYSDNCLKRGQNYFNNFCDSVIATETIEAAELAKLMCNTYRDMNFAFSNEVAMICSNYNIDSNKIIKQTNEGYNRANIPQPSPGVGGYCLSKDPYLFSTKMQKKFYSPSFGRISRKINKKIEDYPIKIFKEFKEKYLKNKKSINVLVLGLAFKGSPPTSDIRESVSIKLINSIVKFNTKIDAFDNYVLKNDLINYKINIVKFPNNEINPKYDIIFSMNNDNKHQELDFSKWLQKNKVKAFFDGWNNFNYLKSLENKNLNYINLGKNL